MSLYLVSYDVAEKNNDYEVLYALLKKWKAARVLYSAWLMFSERPAKEIADEIVATVEDGDRVLVTEITKSASWINLRVSDESFRKWIARLKG